MGTTQSPTPTHPCLPPSGKNKQPTCPQYLKTNKFKTKNLSLDWATSFLPSLLPNFQNKRPTSAASSSHLPHSVHPPQSGSHPRAPWEKSCARPAHPVPPHPHPSLSPTAADQPCLWHLAPLTTQLQAPPHSTFGSWVTASPWHPLPLLLADIVFPSSSSSQHHCSPFSLHHSLTISPPGH